VTTKSIVLAAVIVVGVVAVPLILKSTRALSEQNDQPQATEQAARKPPRFVDLGTTTCRPCKIMLGVMDELKQKYPGAMTIEFINVKERPEEMERYGLNAIPSQIFYDPDGKEMYRHTGVFQADAIIAKWAELGFPMKPSEVK
jgi:thioredoxin 1